MSIDKPAKDKFHIKASLIVILVDDFTNKIIMSSGLNVSIKNEKKPIRKKEGYYVFVNLKPGVYDVCVDSAIYNTVHIKTEVVGSGNDYTTLKIRMIPNRVYPMPKDTTCIEGLAEANSKIYVLGKETSKPYKLLFDYSNKFDQNKTMAIYHPEDVDIEGKVLYIETKDKTSDTFVCVECLLDKEKSLYQIGEALDYSYKKIGTSLYAVAMAEADDTGYFFLPISNLAKEKNTFTCFAYGTKHIIKEQELIAGRVNKISLMEDK